MDASTIRLVAVAAAVMGQAEVYFLPAAAASPYGECQPKVGIHAHQPQYHVIAPQFPGKNGATWPGGVNDANGVFGRSGIFHIFHQCDGGPSGMPCGGGWESANPHPNPAESNWFHSWGHVISKDLATWQRLPDALVPNLTNYEHGEACDGSISFPDSLGPVMMYGPGCDHHSLGNRASHRAGVDAELGDAPVVGVAWPADAADPTLENWTKSNGNPVHFAPGSPPCSFAGRVWKTNNASAPWNMVCASDGGWSRYTTSVFSREQVGPWTLAKPHFAGNRGGASGPAFLPLPSPAHGAPTHVISDGSKSLYSVGTTSPGDSSMNVSASFNTDFGVLGWTAAGIDEATSRVLQVGWLLGGNNDASASKWCPDVQGIKVCGVQALSTIRVLAYHSTWEQLTAYPPPELSVLHNGSLANQTALKLMPSEPHQLPLPAGGGAAMDLVVRFTLPAGNQATPVNLSVAVLNGSDTLRLAVSAGAARNVTILDRPKTWSVAQFTLEKGETELEVRVLVDRSITEWFVGRGRLAVSRRVYPPEGYTNAFVSASAAITVASVEAYDMACGWV